MKHISLLILLTILAFSLNAQIKFFDGSFDQAKELAVKEDKGLFIDFYADWCVPCKQMEKYGFRDKEFSRTIAANFIAVKVDVDQFVGMDVADAYRVKKYPTLILTDSRSKELNRRVGYQSVEQLNEFVQGFK
ncbi:MAG: thioredoxin fold domain-containing protein [Flavobacteriales bacterium]|nr:thioredoxin fold domain-containing protein [Flavobacteriales bacterium]